MSVFLQQKPYRTSAASDVFHPVLVSVAFEVSGAREATSNAVIARTTSNPRRRYHGGTTVTWIRARQPSQRSRLREAAPVQVMPAGVARIDQPLAAARAGREQEKPIAAKSPIRKSPRVVSIGKGPTNGVGS